MANRPATRFARVRPAIGLVLVTIVTITSSNAAPTMSERVRELIATKGVEAARQELPMLVLTEIDGARADREGMLALMDEYLERGDLEAAELVATVPMAAGNDADVAARLGDVYTAKGIPLAASVFYRQALATDPGHQHARARLAEIAKDHPEVPGLGTVAPAPAPPSDRLARPPSTAAERPREPPPAPVRDNKDADDLLPYVVVTDRAELAGLDFDALRDRAGTAYPSRWDDLTLVDSCLWISPATLEASLGLTERVRAARSDFQCKYYVRTPDGYADDAVMLQVYVERHPTAEIVREKERAFREGVSGRQFRPFDAGAPDLHVYVHRKGTYLYAFPRGGRTMWRIGFTGAGPDRDAFDPAAVDAAPEHGLGPRFLRLLVETYGARL